MEIQLKRAYDPEDPNDGYRIYVDRLWPQGLSHQTFHYDWWDKEISPSTELREWYHEDREGRWNEFASRYASELKGSVALDNLQKAIEGKTRITLLFSSKNREQNNAVVLADVLEGKPV